MLLESLPEHVFLLCKSDVFWQSQTFKRSFAGAITHHTVQFRVSDDVEVGLNYCNYTTNFHFVVSHILFLTRLLEYELSDWKLTKIGGEEITLTRMFFYEPNNYVIFETERICEQGANYELELADFTGSLRRDNTGLYRSDYVNSNGEYV